MIKTDLFLYDPFQQDFFLEEIDVFFNPQNIGLFRSMVVMT